MEEKIIHEEKIEKDECCCEHEHHHEHKHEHHHEHEHEHHHDHEHEHDHHDHDQEHHHDHDEHCGCEDEHHHEHEHDEHCGCGHDHDHDHHDHDHHDHDHHDHEHHHHDHGHQYEVQGFRIFETHNHEGATICSFEKDTKADAAVIGKMESCIRELEKWLDATEATIGHVKGYVRESGPVTTFSTVGCGLNIEQHEGGSQMMIGFAAIVFGPTEEELKDKVAEIFSMI